MRCPECGEWFNDRDGEYGICYDCNQKENEEEVYVEVYKYIKESEKAYQYQLTSSPFSERIWIPKSILIDVVESDDPNPDILDSIVLPKWFAEKENLI